MVEVAKQAKARAKSPPVAADTKGKARSTPFESRRGVLSAPHPALPLRAGGEQLQDPRHREQEAARRQGGAVARSAGGRAAETLRAAGANGPLRAKVVSALVALSSSVADSVMCHLWRATGCTSTPTAL